MTVASRSKNGSLGRKPESLTGYGVFLGEIKQRIAAARVSAARAVNRELVRLYWDIGRAIAEKQRRLGSGCYRAPGLAEGSW